MTKLSIQLNIFLILFILFIKASSQTVYKPDVSPYDVLSPSKPTGVGVFAIDYNPKLKYQEALKNLSSSNYDLRINAAKYIFKSKDIYITKDIYREINNENLIVKRYVTATIYYSALTDLNYIASIINLLNSKDATIVVNALGIINNYGDKAISSLNILSNLINSEIYKVKRNAIIAVGKFGGSAKLLIPKLIDIIENGQYDLPRISLSSLAFISIALQDSGKIQDILPHQYAIMTIEKKWGKDFDDHIYNDYMVIKRSLNYLNVIKKLDYTEKNFDSKGLKRFANFGPLTDSINVAFRPYGKKYSIVVGISDYKYLNKHLEFNSMNKMVDLKYAENDANSFVEFLKDIKISGGHWLISSFIGKNAIKENIQSEIERKLLTAKKEDLIYLFFSGHARQSQYDESDIYLMTYNSKQNNYYNGISYDWLKKKIIKSKAEHIVAFIDACRSGIVGFAKGTNTPSNKILGEIGMIKESKVIFTSGFSDQLAWEDDNLRHGVFTYYLIEGLKGKAKNLDNDFFVDLGELENYVKVQVEKHTENNTNMAIQSPHVWIHDGLFVDNFPLAIRQPED